MKKFSKFLLIAAMLGGMSVASYAGDKDPLFVNIITDDPHSSQMAIHFGEVMFNKGHPLTILLNNKGVNVLQKSKASKYVFQQKTISSLSEKGATILYCPMCLQAMKMKESDVIGGVKASDPDTIEQALFKDNTKTLTW
ncbi:MAG: DsrE family protein [Sulfuricurvum sp.]